MIRPYPVGSSSTAVAMLAAAFLLAMNMEQRPQHFAADQRPITQ